MDDVLWLAGAIILGASIVGGVLGGIEKALKNVVIELRILNRVKGADWGDYDGTDKVLGDS